MFRNWQHSELRDTEDPGGAGGDPPETPPDPLAGISASDIIPEEFRGRDPAEIRLLMSQMPRIVKAQKEELDNIRIQMAGGGAATVTHGPPVIQKTVEETQAEFEELFDKDPRAAIKQFIADEYAPTLQGMNSRLNASDMARVRSSMPSFGDFEEDVTSLLTQSGAEATEANIRGAYAMAVGNREIQRQATVARAAENPILATPAPDSGKKLPELSKLQNDVREQMGLSVEDYHKYTDDDSFALKIRT